MKKGMAYLLVFLFPSMLLNAGSAHDPTKPSFYDGQSTSNRQSLMLEGIYRSQGNKLALINGHYYKLGERVGVWKILAIEDDEVIIEQQGKPFHVQLFPGVRQDKQK